MSGRGKQGDNKWLAGGTRLLFKWPGHKAESSRAELVPLPVSAQTITRGHATNPADLGTLLVFITPANSTLASPVNYVSLGWSCNTQDSLSHCEISRMLWNSTDYQKRIHRTNNPLSLQAGLSGHGITLASLAAANAYKYISGLNFVFVV